MNIGLDIKECAKHARDGKVVCFPTETVFGLGVIYSNIEAYNLLNKIKGKREEKPYTMMLADTCDIEKYAYIDNRAKKLIEAFMPGQVTLLLKVKDNVPSFVHHNSNVVGIRIPDYDLVRDLIREVGSPLLVPSANRSNEKPAMNVDEAINIFNDEISYYLKGNIKSGIPSTIINCSLDKITIIRQGGIMKEEIEKVLGEKL